MTGFDEFVNLFGSFTVKDILLAILAIIFLRHAYKKVEAYFLAKFKAKKEKEDLLNDVLAAVKKYPEYRQQSMEIQQALKEDIRELREAQQEQLARLTEMEDNSDRMERNRLRDKLLENYRYFTSKEHNPMQAWTRMESDSFWSLFGDYEKVNGDGYIHTVVQPAMELLPVIDMSDDDSVAELMRTRK